jgi:hypothetical protein
MVDWSPTHAGMILVVIVLILIGASTFELAYQPSPPISNYDSSYYQHTGLMIAQGKIPYVHAWTAKPPMIPLSQWFLAVVSGGDRYLLHWLNIILTAGGSLTAILLLADFAGDFTGDSRAGLAAGLGLLGISAMYLKPAMGFRPKVFVACFGIASLWLQRKEHSFWSGVTGALAAGFWQIGVVFPMMSTLMALESDASTRWRRTVISFLGTVTLMLIPIFWMGALEAMIVETLAVPILVQERFGVLERIKMLTVWTNFTLPILVLGGVGLLTSLSERHFRRPWIWLGAVVVMVQVLFIDLDGPADAIVFFVFVALGLSYWMTIFNSTVGDALVVAMIGLIVLSGASKLEWIDTTGMRKLFRGHWSFRTQSYLSNQPRDEILQFRKKDSIIESWHPDHYWTDAEPAGCYYRQSRPIRRWMRETGGRPDDQTCGELQSIRRYFQDSTKPWNKPPRESHDKSFRSF